MKIILTLELILWLRLEINFDIDYRIENENRFQLWRCDIKQNLNLIYIENYIQATKTFLIVMDYHNSSLYVQLFP